LFSTLDLAFAGWLVRLSVWHYFDGIS